MSSLFADDGEIKAGEAVQFTTYVPNKAVTRTTEETAFNTRMSAYKVVNQNYTFTVEMFQKAEAPATEHQSLGSCTYVPTTITNAGEENNTDGELKVKDTATPLYWPGNAKEYGFMATAGTTTLATDQSDADKLLAQDLLEGYGFEPLWDTTNNRQTDSETSLNFRTSKEWYQANKTTRLMAPGGVDEKEWYKKIPLYLQHKRAMITIKLKAGEGVKREDLAFTKAKENIQTFIYDYSTNPEQAITPLAKEEKIAYTAEDYGGAAVDVATTAYTAIVTPHNYLAAPTSDKIAEIKLSGQRFTFYASNDNQYKFYNVDDKTTESYRTAETTMNGYNLQPGQHLVITATLGRESRKIVITAYVEDWTEAVTTSILDDYGQAGDPVQISTRQQLYEFLSNPQKNKAGAVAIIVPNSLNLEKNGNADLAWDYNTDDDVNNDLPLRATLNLAGATLRTDHPLFKTIYPTGNIVNGTITIGTDKGTETTVATAIADVNYGSIEHINVLAKDANGNSSKAYATCAGLVRSNSGTITGCTSELPVYGTSGVVGGIASESVYSMENGNTMPVIDGCTVNARVAGKTRGLNDEDNSHIITCGGGIVGKAVGRVTNNTFAYGRTVLQHQSDFKNSIYAKADDSHELRASGNAWPTKATSDIAGDSNANDAEYDGVIDSQEELHALTSNTQYNKEGMSFRISNDFTVTKNKVGDVDGWNYGVKTTITNATGATGNVQFKLDGDNHTITTDAMLFSNITGEVRNLTIQLSDNLIAEPTKTKNDKQEEEYDGLDIMAPLAYSVIGGIITGGGVISNIKVKGGDYRIQASTPAGVVVWARGGAKVENCQCEANIQMWVNGDGTTSENSKKYAGGIVAQAAKATITRCKFYSTSGTLFRNKTANPVTASTQDMSDTSPGLYYGGILGATATPENNETPSVVIADCSSWFSTENNEHKGAIVGYAFYSSTATGSTKLEYGIADNGCQGNWWGESRAIGTYTNSDGQNKTIEELLGKKNAVPPTVDSDF